MIVGLVELVLIGLVLALLGLCAWSIWTALQRSTAASVAGGAVRLPSRERAELAAAIAQARWVPGHDEVDGETRVLVRRTYTGLNGLPVVLEERVLDTFPALDPAWEARFTEAMSNARFRCAYLNAEESQ
jgi:hypothetical protein